MLHIPAEGQIIELKDTQGRFGGKIQQQVKMASYHDNFIFKDIQMRCPGDEEPRYGGSFTVFIKAAHQPTIVFDQLRNATDSIPIDITKMQRQSQLLTSTTAYGEKDACQVLSFTLVQENNAGQTIAIVNPSPIFTTAVIKAIEQAKSTEKLTFRDIQIRCKGDKEDRKAADIIITIK